MKVRRRSRLSAARINSDHPTPCILFDLIEMSPRASESMRLVRIAAEHHQQVAVLDILRRVAILRAKQVTIDPEVTGLLLRERVSEIRRAHRAHQRNCEWTARNIALPSAAIERKRIAAVRGADLIQALRDLAQRRIPGDWLEAAVGAPAQRSRQAIRLILVVVEPLRLLTSIALGIRMQFVAAHLDYPAPLSDDLDSAVDVAEVAGSLPPFSCCLLLFTHDRTPIDVLTLLAGLASLDY